jgi:hypothetical protein
MCDIITRAPENGNLAQYCLHGNRFLCESKDKCPNLWADLGARATRLCNFHTSFCRHCARTFCPECIGPHEQSCSMRPPAHYVTVWDRVEKLLSKVGMMT